MGVAASLSRSASSTRNEAEPRALALSSIVEFGRGVRKVVRVFRKQRRGMEWIVHGIVGIIGAVLAV